MLTSPVVAVVRRCTARRLGAAALSIFVGVVALTAATPGVVRAQPITAGGLTTDAAVQPSLVAPGASVTITVTARSDVATSVLLDVEISNAVGALVHQKVYDNQAFTAGQIRSYAISWTVPAAEPAGTHTVRIGVFGVGWGALRHWNNSATAFNVAAGGIDERTSVMPLGDSLTDGYNIPGGYRIDLAAQFAAAGMATDFVGSLINGPATLTDREHEGHSGWRIDQISASITSWMNAYQPDVVLLMIGTNDVVQDYQLATAPDRLSSLIDQIVVLAPATHVIVSSIPRIGGSPNSERVQAYNATVPGIVGGKVAAGKRVSFVDAYAVIGAGDLHTDYTHLNASGYSKLANAWYPAVRTALGLGGPSPDTVPPTVTTVSPLSGATGVGAMSNVVATFSEPLAAATMNSTTFELRTSAGAVVAATLAYDATTKVATLDPTNSLAAASTYTVRLKGGPSDPRVTDVAGNSLAADVVWSFTTSVGGSSAPGYTSGGYTTTAGAGPTTVVAGQTTQIDASVTSASAGSVLVDVEVYSPTGGKVFQKAWDQQTFTAGQRRTFTTPWTVPSSAATGQYVVRIGIFTPGWGTCRHWNGSAAQVTVTR